MLKIKRFFMKLKLVLLYLLLSNLFLSQIKKDSTFTIASEYKKNISKYPFIKDVIIAENNLEKHLNVVYDTSSGRNLHLDAFINPSKEQLPALIIIHGGGWKSGTKEMQNPMAEKIAVTGYQTFTIEYRLSDEAIYPAATDDVMAAIRYLKKNAKKFKIDLKKIAVLGTSSGAQMASLIGTKYPNEIQAVINIDGVLAFHHPDSAEGKSASLFLGGTYDEKPHIWNEASALSHVSKKTPPLLFIHSQFKRFNAGREDFIKKLDEYQIYSQVESIENSPHTFWLFEPWFETTNNYIINFLNLNFKKNKK